MTTLVLEQQKKNELISAFTDLINKGIECWKAAGEIVVSLIDDYEMDIEDIATASKYLTQDIVGRFEQIGRKQIIPDLLVAGYPASNYMLRLPYSEQKRLAENSVELLIAGEKESSSLMVTIENLTADQCRQVFEGNKVRSLAAQRAWLEDRTLKERQKTTIRDTEPAYTLNKKKVIFNRPCEMTRQQLAKILSEFE
jgi:hypothetical protein